MQFVVKIRIKKYQKNNIYLAIYSYKNKLGGWNKAKEKIILLPEKNGEIDFDFMDKFIIIAEKLIIKDVVEYTDKKINATKRIVNNRS